MNRKFLQFTIGAANSLVKGKTNVASTPQRSKRVNRKPREARANGALLSTTPLG